MNNKKKIIIAWATLLILFIMLLIINYVKFFGTYTYDENEVIEIENSTSEAITTALTEIVTNFNNDDSILTYKEQGILISAVLKNHSIYITYQEEKTTTYEFNYNNLILSINITNEEENINKFNTIYKILIKAIQKRIKNEENIEELINSQINDNIKLSGIEKIENSNIISYKIDITKKLKEGE